MDRSGGHLIAAFLPIKITQTSDWKVWANDQMLPHRSKQFTIYQWCVWKFKLNKKQFTNAKYYKILQSVFHPCGRYKKNQLKRLIEFVFMTVSLWSIQYLGMVSLKWGSSKQTKIKTKASDFGSVVSAVASYSRGPRFESSHQRNSLKTYFLLTLKGTKSKVKRDR